MVCDDHIHCLDGSDESSCEDVYKGANYIQNRPPIPDKLFHDAIPYHYLSLQTKIVIVDIIEINQDPGAVSIFMKLVLEWYDDNAEYTFLKDDHYLNPIDKTTEGKIWTPSIGYTYLNGQEIAFRTLVVKKKNNPILSGDINETNPKELFLGNQNSFELEIFQTVKFLCHFRNKDLYPYGEDACSLYIYLENNDNLLATFDPVELGKLQLTSQFVIFSSTNYQTIIIIFVNCRKQWTNLFRQIRCC